MSDDIDWTPNELKRDGNLVWWKAGDEDGSQGTTHVLIARTELAALRRRAEDAEMIVGLHGDCRFRVWAIRDYTTERYNLPRLWKIRCLAHGLSDGITLKADPATGLPILTDEARRALEVKP